MKILILIYIFFFCYSVTGMGSFPVHLLKVVSQVGALRGGLSKPWLHRCSQIRCSLFPLTYCLFCVAELRNECAIIWCKLKPPKYPERAIPRSGDLEGLIPPSEGLLAGGLGGQNHTQNQQRCLFSITSREEPLLHTSRSNKKTILYTSFRTQTRLDTSPFHTDSIHVSNFYEVECYEKSPINDVLIPGIRSSNWW